MSWVENILRKVNLLPYSHQDEEIEQSIRDAYADHAEALAQVELANEHQKEGNSRLRESIELAKAKSNSVFAAFELSIRHADREDRFPNA
jgi:hypothetical protein